MEFPFIGLPTEKGQVVYKPFIPVTLNFRKAHTITKPILGLIDTGADVCFCHKDIGSFLKINFKGKRTQLFTAANNQQFPTQAEQIRVYVGKTNIDVPFYFTDSISINFPIILGVKGFLKRYRLTLDYPKKIISLE